MIQTTPFGPGAFCRDLAVVGAVLQAAVGALLTVVWLFNFFAASTIVSVFWAVSALLVAAIAIFLGAIPNWSYFRSDGQAASRRGLYLSAWTAAILIAELVTTVILVQTRIWTTNAII